MGAVPITNSGASFDSQLAFFGCQVRFASWSSNRAAASFVDDEDDVEWAYERWLESGQRWGLARTHEKAMVRETLPQQTRKGKTMAGG